jgi:hypothetical protein
VTGDRPEDSRGVTVALAAFHHALGTGSGSRLAMLAALRAVSSLMKEEITEEAAQVTMETVLEATAIANARVAELEAAMDEMLAVIASFWPLPDARLALWRQIRHSGSDAVAAGEELSRLGEELQGGDPK